MGRTIMCISHPGIWVGIWVGNNNQRTKRREQSKEVDKWITRIENVFSGMICYKGHKCWFSSSSSNRLLWTQLNVPYNCPFIHNVYLPCTSHKVLLNHYTAFCLDKF